MKKYERITAYLENLRKKDKKKLVNVTWQQLRKLRRFKDIGDRTLINILKEFKLNNPKIFPHANEQQPLKKDVVDTYLEKLYKKNPKKLTGLSGQDLLDVEELKGIGKTTLVCSLSDFRKKHSLYKRKKSDLDDLTIKPTSRYKKNKVESTLTRMMLSISISDLYDLKPKDLYKDPSLKNVSKETINKELESFKKKFFVGSAIKCLKISNR